MMRITKEMLSPSREDAVRLNRQEKMGMIVMAYAATIMDDLQQEIRKRLEMIPDGAERMRKLSEETDALLNDLRMTIPVNQRMNLQNTAQDYEIHLLPKASPCETSVVMQKDEFKELVDLARVTCRECTHDDKSCEQCRLFQLLTVILPLDDYDNGLLCPYNMGEWAN